MAVGAVDLRQLASRPGAVPQFFARLSVEGRECEGVGAVIEVANTRPAATTGQPMPSPSFTDHLQFSLAEKFAGNGAVDVEMPVQLGPRNCGQSSARASVTMMNQIATAAVRTTVASAVTSSLLFRRSTYDESSWNSWGPR